MGFLLGVIVGATAGALAALLVTPRSGAENRSRLGGAIPTAPETASQASEDLKARLEAGREAFSEGAAETRERMAAEVERARKDA